ncbi:hypothetical protein L3Y34_012405 [Caenorhabditis briggsae]|uniref:Uncharacterized protein n=1 Tax=Caenorhabditis briggsae TaxID=6238 RepID=A0AAE8ZVN7_CAEBR|nr:hypothetical protein L3Y34_012405 [Caenorhabditis briggsae]
MSTSNAQTPTISKDEERFGMHNFFETSGALFMEAVPNFDEALAQKVVSAQNGVLHSSNYQLQKANVCCALKIKKSQDTARIEIDKIQNEFDVFINSIESVHHQTHCDWLWNFRKLQQQVKELKEVCIQLEIQKSRMELEFLNQELDLYDEFAKELADCDLQKALLKVDIDMKTEREIKENKDIDF